MTDAAKKFLILFELCAFIYNAAAAPTPDTATVALSLRVIGGADVDIIRHPYEVSIRRRYCAGCSYAHYCGGIIYSRNVILTAAQCVAGVKESVSLQVVVGSSWRTGAAQDGRIYPIVALTTHTNASIDIALVRLGVDIELNDVSVGVARLAQEVPRAGRMAVVAGWGQQHESDPDGGSEQLRELRVPIVAQQQCAEYYRAWRALGEFELCAGYVDGGVDTCQGDAGSPLLVNGEVIGLVSWGYGCARPRYPGVYTNVVALRAWIEENM